jgi:hypothetical protein
MHRSSLVAAFGLPALLAIPLATYALVGTAHGDGDAPKSVAKIEHVMQTFNDGPTSVVGQLRDAFNQPTLDDEAWDHAVGRATMVMEAANLLWGMKPPRGADDAVGIAKWREHVMAYRGCADAAREAATKKDLAAGKAAITSLSKKCSECHKDHRPD